MTMADEEEGPERAKDILGHRLGIGRKRHIGQRGGIELDPHEQAGGKDDADEQAEKAGQSGGALPEHAEENDGQQRRNEDAEQRLHVVHDAVGVHHQVGAPMETATPMRMESRPTST